MTRGQMVQTYFCVNSPLCGRVSTVEGILEFNHFSILFPQLTLVLHIVLHQLCQSGKLLPAIQVIEVSHILNLDVCDLPIPPKRLKTKKINTMMWILISKVFHINLSLLEESKKPSQFQCLLTHRTESVKSPGLDLEGRARNDPSMPRSFSRTSATRPETLGWNHLLEREGNLKVV